jgi:hypothetical protein
MNKNYKITKTVDPHTFDPIVTIFYKEKTFVRINVAMSKEDAKTFPFSNKENFENDWNELADSLKDFLKNI